MLTSSPIASTQRIEFSIINSTGRKCSTEHVQIVQHTGKCSMKFKFSSKLSLKAESKTELNHHIEQLQQQPAQHRIHSFLKNRQHV